METQSILQQEGENVRKLIKAARDHADSGETAVKPYVDKLDAVARNWDKIAQPIQLSSKARGIDHEASRDLAYEIRSLAIDLFNKHDMLAQSQRLTRLIQEIFAEIPEIADRVEEDADALADIFQQRKQASARQDEWAREITYRAEIGVMFKDTLEHLAPRCLVEGPELSARLDHARSLGWRQSFRQWHSYRDDLTRLRSATGVPKQLWN